MLAGVNSAAFRVFIGDGPRAKEFGFIERICALEKTKGAGNRSASLRELRQGLEDADEYVRGYAVDTLVGEFLEGSPEQVVGILRDGLLRANALGARTTGFFRLLGSLVRSRQIGVKARIACVRELALLAADAHELSVRSCALTSLAEATACETFETPTGFAIRGSASELPFKARDVLSGDEMARLRSAAAGVGKDGQLAKTAAIVNRWLND